MGIDEAPVLGKHKIRAKAFGKAHQRGSHVPWKLWVL